MQFKEVLNNKIFKAGSWYTLANFFAKGITFITIPLFTYLLTPAEYGLTSLYISWLSIFTVFIGFSLNESIRRAKFEFENEYNEFVSSITFLSSIIFICYLSIFLMFENFFTILTGFSSFIFYFMIIQAFFSYIIEMAFTKYRMEYRYKLTSIINIIISVLSVGISIFLIYSFFNDEKYIGKIIGSGLPYIVMGVIFFIILLDKGRKLVNLKYWKFSLVLGIPLIFHNLGLIINAQIDRIFINNYWGPTETGIYSLACQIGIIIQVLFTSLDQAWNPWFFEKYKNNDYIEIKHKAKILRNTFTVLYASVLMITPEIVKVMTNETYWGAIEIIPWIFMGNFLIFIYAFEVNIEYANKKSGLIAIGTIISAILNIILNIIFVPTYGYTGAAITTVISYLFLFLFHYFITSKVIKKKVYGFTFHIQSIIYVLIITMCYLFFQKYLGIRILIIIITLLLFTRNLKNSK